MVRYSRVVVRIRCSWALEISYEAEWVWFFVPPSNESVYMNSHNTTGTRPAVILGPGEGRSYPMGRISAVFKADGAETQARYSISEWWLEPNTQGPGPHAHPEDDIFFVIEGTMSLLVGEEWVEANKGSFVLIPGGVTHDFENRGSTRAGVLNFSIPGDFEQHMPGIVQWFVENPPKNAGT